MVNRYIVTFKDDTPQDEVDKAAKEVEDAGGKITNRYDTVMKGFAAEIPDSHFQSLQAQSLKSDSKIDFIEQDGVATTQALT